VEDINALTPLDAKFESFGWRVIEVDGHDVGAVRVALHQARESHDVPVCIIAHTVKGKGVTFMENNNEFHGKAPSSDQLKVALAQISQ
jgi:transketolase